MSPILRIALPSIVSNITVPLLGLVDTAITGHLGAASYIGAIAVGGMLFNMVYWLFGFLRMGTGGFTSQAYGAADHAEARRTLLRSLTVAAAIACVLIALQGPLLATAFRFIDATPETACLATRYFRILIWGAPAVLGLYSLAGWFLGMQNARYPMLVAIVQNGVNIAVSLLLVVVLGMKVEGVALGTLTAQYAGLLLALFLLRRMLRRLPHVEAASLAWHTVFSRPALARFFHVNRDIFLRTLCLVAVTTAFTSAGASQGDLVLAANALLMQFFMLFSYVMDGFAYAGEALGGRFYGARDLPALYRLTRSLFLWGTTLALAFTLLYAVGGTSLLRLLTDQADVAATASRFLPYAVAVPLLGFAAFLLDGLFIGTTSTRAMLLSMLVASAAFFTCHALLASSLGNHALWIAFLLYLVLRGAVEAVLLPRCFRGAAAGERRVDN